MAEGKLPQTREEIKQHLTKAQDSLNEVRMRFERHHDLKSTDDWKILEALIVLVERMRNDLPFPVE